MIHKMVIQRDAFEGLKNESLNPHKVILRSHDEKRNKITDGDHIIFINKSNGEQFVAHVNNPEYAIGNLNAYEIIVDGVKSCTDSPCDFINEFDEFHSQSYKINIKNENVSFEVVSPRTVIRFPIKATDYDVNCIAIYAYYDENLIYGRERNCEQALFPIVFIDVNKNAPYDALKYNLNNLLGVDEFDITEIGYFETELLGLPFKSKNCGIMYIVDVKTLKEHPIEKIKRILHNINELPNSTGLCDEGIVLLDYFRKMYAACDISFEPEWDYSGIIKYYDEMVSLDYDNINAEAFKDYVLRRYSGEYDIIAQRMSHIRHNEYNFNQIIQSLKDGDYAEEYLDWIMEHLDNPANQMNTVIELLEKYTDIDTSKYKDKDKEQAI